MDYAAALHRILSLTDYERLAAVGSHPPRYDLGRMEALLERLDNPHRDVSIVHVAGSKGKGSTAALCASVLAAQGYPTGLFTSPHLHTFRERIQVRGEPIGEGEFAALVEELWPPMEEVNGLGVYGKVTVFELLTAMAFFYFRKRGVKFQVLEVGLGGRLDATNVVLPRVCVITSVNLDHTQILGDSVEQIAWEKAGIVKAGATVVSSPQPPQAQQVIREVCSARGAPLMEVGVDLTWRRGSSNLEGQSFQVRGRLGGYPLWMPLLGDYQLENATTAIAALEALQEQGFPLSQEAIARGFSRVRWPCRMEVLKTRPLVVADGAHNPYSAARLRDSLPLYFPYRQVILVIGVSADKNLEGVVGELASLQPRVLTTCSRHPRAAPPSALAEAFARHGIHASPVEGVGRAMARAMEEAREGGLVLATGSLFVAAEAREAFKGIAPEVYPELQRSSLLTPSVM